MLRKPKSKSTAELRDSDHIAEVDSDEAPTKAEILAGISEGYQYAMSGGEGQPIDQVHREIADELRREELADNADIRP